MTTLSTLRIACRNLIGDTSSTVFTDTQLNLWINSAIQQLSIHFPRRLEYDIDTLLDSRIYELPENVISILSAQYNADDPSGVYYLKYREPTHPDFWTQDGYYCLVKRFDAYLADDAPVEGYGEPPELWISTKPATAETVRLEYFCEHAALSDDDDILTVLPRHEHLIHLFVRWKAWSELATTEGMDPDPTEALSATLEINAGRAEKSYLQALKDAQQSESETGQAHLYMDKWDRIY